MNTCNIYGKREYLKAKLRPFQEILNTFKWTPVLDGLCKIHHSCGAYGAQLTISGNNWPEDIVEIDTASRVSLGRQIFKIKGYKPPHSQSRDMFYDEWFEWIGAPPEHIPAELWEID